MGENGGVGGGRTWDEGGLVGRRFWVGMSGGKGLEV